MIDGSWLSGLAALIAVGVSAYSVLQARHVRQRSDIMQQSKVDAGAYDRARLIYESSIKELEHRVTDLTSRLTSMSLEKDKLQQQVWDLQALAERLRRTLTANGIKLEGNYNVER